jgi:hypothetical protein
MVRIHNECFGFFYSLLTKNFFFSRLVVLFSIERFFAIYFPLRKDAFFRHSKQKMIVGFMVAFGLCFYSYNLIVTNVERYNKQCVTSHDFIYFTSLMVVIHVILVMLAPFCIILITNTLIFIKLTRSHLFFVKKCDPNFSSNNSIFKIKSLYEKRSIRIDVNGKYSLKKTENKVWKITTHGEPRRNTYGCDLKHNVFFPKSSISNFQKRNKIFSKTNRVLLAITSTFLVLYLPISLFKIFSFISNVNVIESIQVSLNFSFMEHSSDYSVPDKKNMTRVNFTEIINVSENSNKQLEMALLEKFASNLYYLNFITNFFLYNLVGTKFRKDVKKSLKSFRNKKMRLETRKSSNLLWADKRPETGIRLQTRTNTNPNNFQK